MSEKILFVDDDSNLLASYQRQLRGQYTVDTSSNGQEGLESIFHRGPYAIVISDYRMPGMDGVTFLTRVREASPDTVRMLLTGYADLQTAIDAVNQGNIFRLLTKPCPPDALANALAAGFDQYRLVIAERERAEKEKASLEEQLRQAQKMQAIGTLAGGIAHDFNNILTAILGYAELAISDIAEDSRTQYNLQQSIKAAHRAKDLVQQILTFSRQGKQERKPLNINPIIKEVLKFLRASLPSTIEIRPDIEEDLGTIEADPTQVHQVLMNLCTNAAHAMGENGGVLGVSLSKWNVDAETSAAATGIEAGPYLRLRVSDTGHGMPPEIMERIFEPYFTTKEVGKGTGLGLAVVHGIVKSYGGEIRVSGEAGKGSTFDIYFPTIDTPKEIAASFKRESPPAGGHERILFVDDEQTLVQLGQEMLKRLGYQVTIRTSSVEALELFRAKPDQFDLVITDMTMPNMMGDKLAIELMRIRPAIPIILCTGFSEYITKEKAQSIGIQELLLKPIVMTDLARGVRQVIDQSKGGG